MDIVMGTVGTTMLTGQGTARAANVSELFSGSRLFISLRKLSAAFLQIHWP